MVTNAIIQGSIIVSICGGALLVAAALIYFSPQTQEVAVRHSGMFASIGMMIISGVGFGLMSISGIFLLVGVSGFLISMVFAAEASEGERREAR